MRRALRTKSCIAAIERTAETSAKRTQRCTQPRRKAMMQGARQIPGIDADAAHGAKEAAARREEAASYEATVLANSAGERPRGGGPPTRDEPTFEKKKECGAALVKACPKVSAQMLWDGFEPWDRCPTRINERSGTPQDTCQAAILENSPACAGIGRTWQSRAECWPPEER